MKLYVSRTVKLAALILPAVLLMLLLPYNSRIETSRVRGFYKEGNHTLDVVMMGASEVFAGFSPGLAYAEYGFTSYDYAISQNYPEILQSQVAEVVRTQAPQVIVMDLNTLMFVGRSSSQDAVFRTYIEGVPLSLNKVKTIREFPYREQPLSYYVPFIMYHGNVTLQDIRTLWSNEKALWENGGALLKGSVTCLGDSTLGEVWDLSQDSTRVDLPEDYERELREFLEYCGTLQDTQVLFVAYPHRITTDMAYLRLCQLNTAAQIVEDYGFDFINMEHMTAELGLDFQRDFYNDEHVNIYGQKKVTRYLARLLTEDYGVSPRPQTEKNRGRWEETVKFTQLLYAYYEKLTDNGGKELMLCEESWLISELRWMENKLKEDGLPLTFGHTYLTA